MDGLDDDYVVARGKLMIVHKGLSKHLQVGRNGCVWNDIATERHTFAKRAHYRGSIRMYSTPCEAQLKTPAQCAQAVRAVVYLRQISSWACNRRRLPPSAPSTQTTLTAEPEIIEKQRSQSQALHVLDPLLVLHLCLLLRLQPRQLPLAPQSPLQPLLYSSPWMKALLSRRSHYVYSIFLLPCMRSPFSSPSVRYHFCMAAYGFIPEDPRALLPEQEPLK